MTVIIFGVKTSKAGRMEEEVNDRLESILLNNPFTEKRKYKGRS